MRKLIVRVLILTGPFLVILVIPAAVLFGSHELLSFKEITAIHNGNREALIGPAYSNPDKYMKLNATLLRKPQILALGTSRIMQIKQVFFKKAFSFYNAGGGVEKIKQFNFFLKKIPVQLQPEVLFISLDQYFFNTKFDNLLVNNFEEEYQDNFSALSYIIDNSFSIWQQVFNGKSNPLKIRSKNVVGLNAGINRNGFVFDGSYYYGERLSHPERCNDYNFKDTYNRIEKGNKRFEYGTTINLQAILSLNEFLSACSKRSIKVYAFFPPYANSVIARMRSSGDKYVYIDKLYDAIEPVFKKYNFSLFNFTDPGKLGMSDKNFIDGFHGSDKVYLRMIQQMCKQDTSLGKYFDANYLDELYAGSKNDLEIL